MSISDGAWRGDDHREEQFPLAPVDDFMIHQTLDPIRVMWSSDPQVYERYWLVFHDLVGDLVAVICGSFYPTLDRAEAFVLVNWKGTHHTVRAFRRLGVDRMDIAVGPIEPTVVRGLRLWRHVLQENDSGVTYDLQFRDTKRQVYREPMGRLSAADPPGRQRQQTAGFEGFGEVEGWLDIAGERVTLAPGTAKGARDRHWGIGRAIGGPRHDLSTTQRHGLSGNNYVDFGDFAFWGNHIHYNFGDRRPGVTRAVRIERRLRFEPETRLFLEGIIDYHLENGEVKQLHYERIANQTAFMRCGMYGGTPDGTRYQGGDYGDGLVETEVHDVNDPKVRAHLAGLDEHLCRVTCDGQTTTGVFQPIDPDAYEACVAGVRGWSLWPD